MGDTAGVVEDAVFELELVVCEVPPVEEPGVPEPVDMLIVVVDPISVLDVSGIEPVVLDVGTEPVEEVVEEIGSVVGVDPVVGAEPVTEVDPVVREEPVMELGPVVEEEPVVETDSVVREDLVVSVESVVDVDPVVYVDPVAEVELSVEVDPVVSYVSVVGTLLEGVEPVIGAELEPVVTVEVDV